VIEHMTANLAQNLTIDDLCGVAGVSRSQLAVIFQRETRQTPMRYLERLRIERAMQLLRLATPTLDELAADVGFCDAKHFARRFKLLVGTTPSEYRRSQPR
jgi:transcriptional regulator GlxA family with amidase domain